MTNGAVATTWLTGRPLLLEIHRAVGDLLSPLGFTRHGEGRFTRPITKATEGSIGLNAASDPGRGYKMNPIAGVRHQEIERIWAEVEGRRFAPHGPATITYTIDALMGRHHTPWLFGYGNDTLVIAKSMVEAIREYALPFYERSNSLEAIIEELPRSHVSMYSPYRLPIALLLAGDAQGARREIARGLDRRSAGINAVPPRAYAEFATAFERYLAARGL